MRKATHRPRPKLIVRRCHKCEETIEAHKEQQKCHHCGKSFLPLNYFVKVHEHDPQKFLELYAEGHELNEDDLVKGLFVLW